MHATVVWLQPEHAPGLKILKSPPLMIESFSAPFVPVSLTAVEIGELTRRGPLIVRRPGPPVFNAAPYTLTLLLLVISIPRARC